MYHHIEVLSPDAPGDLIQGSAYDLCQGGAHIELDEKIEPGTMIQIALHLPGGLHMIQQPVRALATVIWVDEDGSAGPVRCAVEFQSFPQPDDAARLRRYLGGSQLRLAA